MFKLRQKKQSVPPESEIRGHTVPALLEDAIRLNPNPNAFQQPTDLGWSDQSHQALLTTSREIALGLLSLGLETGDRVAMILLSDLFFCTVDLGCLTANLVNVPIDLSQTLENIIFSLHHSEAKVLVIANHTLLQQITPYLCHAKDLQTIVVIDNTDADLIAKSEVQSCSTQSQPTVLTVPESIGLDLSHPTHPGLSLCPLPDTIQLISWDQLSARGRSDLSDQRLEALEQGRSPQTLATLIYIPDPSGKLKGVMLTHENLSSNALAAFREMPKLKRGDKEVVVSFLPLTHIFARTLLYGHIYYGHRVYFSNPQRVMKHLQKIHPTILATVPLLLHKVHEKLWAYSHQSDSPLSSLKIGFQTSLKTRSFHPLQKTLKTLATQNWVKQKLHHWALGLTQSYELGQRIKGWQGISTQFQRAIADILVYRQWRKLFGGRLRFMLSGGAALRGDVANFFAAAGLPILQGYGLTQTSSVVSFNRMRLNRANTVGIPALGVECAIAADGEILVRGPGVTAGYYKAPDLTQSERDPDGWFHTGDLGRFTSEGFLAITGAKKALFKLSTGKYVTPVPLEEKLVRSPLLDKAWVLGADRKFCAALLFFNAAALHKRAALMGIGDLPTEALLENPCMVALFQTIVDEANCHLPYWSTIKRFRLLPAIRLEANDLLSEEQVLNRNIALEVFADEINAMYQRPRRKLAHPRSRDQAELCPDVPVVSCPIAAQSLKTGLP